MKTIFFILLILTISKSNASNWQFLGTIPNAKEYVDISSLSKSGKYRKAWFLVVYDKDQYIPDKNPFAEKYFYRSYKELVYFLCNEKSYALVQRVFYSGENSDVAVPNLRIANKVEEKIFNEITPDTDGEAQLIYACSNLIKN